MKNSAIKILMVVLVTFLPFPSLCQDLNVVMDGKSVSVVYEESIFKNDIEGVISLVKSKQANFDSYMIMISINKLDFCSSKELGELGLVFQDGKVLFLPQVSDSECSDPFFGAYSLNSRRTLKEGRLTSIKNEQSIVMERLEFRKLKMIYVSGSNRKKTIEIKDEFQNIFSKYIKKIEGY